MPHVVAVDRVPVERQRGRDPDLLAAEPRLPAGRVPVVAEGLDAPEHRPGDAADARGLDALREAQRIKAAGVRRITGSVLGSGEDRKSTRRNSSHSQSRMPASARKKKPNI